MDIGKEPQLHFFTPSPDRVDQVMAGGARFAGGVAGKPFPIGYRAIFSNGRKISIDAGGWRWNLLAQELLPHEETASRGRRVFRLASQGEKEGLPQHSG